MHLDGKATGLQVLYPGLTAAALRVLPDLQLGLARCSTEDRWPNQWRRPQHQSLSSLHKTLLI
jgi:hypothetical protein